MQTERSIGIVSTGLFGTAQSIAEDEFSLYHGTNSDILKRLDNIPEPSISSTTNNAILFDLSALIRVKAYSNCKNFNEFALLLYQHFSKLSEGYNREIISDRYFEKSLKEGTRKKRGEGGSKFIVNGAAVIPKDFSKVVLRNSKNKDDVGIFLLNKFLEFHKTSQVLVVSIKNTVASNKTDIAIESLIFHSNIEEADSKPIRHSINLFQHGYQKAIIKTLDTDFLSYCIF